MREKKSNPHLIYPTIETVDVSHLEQSMSYVQYSEKRVEKITQIILWLWFQIYFLEAILKKKKRYRTRSHFDKILWFLNKNW